MPRTHRIDFEGARHHVMNRGARRAPVFANDEARGLFVEVLAELPDQFGVRIHGYAVMPNHLNLLLETPRANLSESMRRLGGEFIQRLNRRHGWDGPVFRGRFRNRVAGDLRYWMHLLAYVHLNPVAAGLVQRPEETTWTSHRAYLGLSETPPWLTTAEMHRLVGCARHRRVRGRAPDRARHGAGWLGCAGAVEAEPVHGHALSSAAADRELSAPVGAHGHRRSRAGDRLYGGTLAHGSPGPPRQPAPLGRRLVAQPPKRPHAPAGRQNPRLSALRRQPHARAPARPLRRRRVGDVAGDARERRVVGPKKAKCDRSDPYSLGVDGRAWPWGDRFEPAFYRGERFTLHDVGLFPDDVSPYGVHDLVTGVLEWTLTAARDDPDACYVRGGCSTLPLHGQPCTSRITRDPRAPSPFIGFRLVIPG